MLYYNELLIDEPRDEHSIYVNNNSVLAYIKKKLLNKLYHNRIISDLDINDDISKTYIKLPYWFNVSSISDYNDINGSSLDIKTKHFIIKNDSIALYTDDTQQFILPLITKRDIGNTRDIENIITNVVEEIHSNIPDNPDYFVINKISDAPRDGCKLMIMKKIELIEMLNKMQQDGIRLTKNYTISDPYIQIQCEYEMHMAFTKWNRVNDSYFIEIWFTVLVLFTILIIYLYTQN